jgi:hypothetical protein
VVGQGLDLNLHMDVPLRFPIKKQSGSVKPKNVACSSVSGIHTNMIRFISKGPLSGLNHFKRSSPGIIAHLLSLHRRNCRPVQTIPPAWWLAWAKTDSGIHYSVCYKWRIVARTFFKYFTHLCMYINMSNVFSFISWPPDRRVLGTPLLVCWPG